MTHNKKLILTAAIIAATALVLTSKSVSTGRGAANSGQSSGQAGSNGTSNQQRDRDRTETPSQDRDQIRDDTPQTDRTRESDPSAANTLAPPQRILIDQIDELEDTDIYGHALMTKQEIEDFKNALKKFTSQEELDEFFRQHMNMIKARVK